LQPISLATNFSCNHSNTSRGYNQFAETGSELLFEYLFKDVGLRAYAAISGAVIVHVELFLDLSEQRTTSMAPDDRVRKGDIMRDLTVPFLVPAIQNLLHAFPSCAITQRRMDSLVRLPA
jgi:hypothetical protein